MFTIRIVALLCAKKISNLRNKKNLCISSTFFVINCVIPWIVIYPVDSAYQSSKNRDHGDNPSTFLSTDITQLS